MLNSRNLGSISEKNVRTTNAHMYYVWTYQQDRVNPFCENCYYVGHVFSIAKGGWGLWVGTMTIFGSVYFVRMSILIVHIFLN